MTVRVVSWNMNSWQQPSDQQRSAAWGARLDALQAACWPRAEAGDLKAIDEDHGSTRSAPRAPCGGGRHPGPGRDYYAKKIAEGKTTGEARRALKRHLADLVYATICADAQRSPGGQVGASTRSSAADLIPMANTSDKSLPGLHQQATTDVA